MRPEDLLKTVDQKTLEAVVVPSPEEIREAMRRCQRRLRDAGKTLCSVPTSTGTRYR